ncbi:helix-turn-helix transcriptional regulator [Clostridium sp. BSD9I1]|uniref:helix-turn-helix transcriptional regulator n=1 Tax=Clostridium sp. BSD9I1 TaxID=2003589 RepID=UPI00164846B1|nr:helix-turn-helix transcriptional regulator [Clostridium sp. BSD9I1]
MVKRKKLFNTKIKVLRVERNLTQEDLAIDLGVNRGTILEIERGTFNPSLKLAFSIAKYFDKTVDEVFEILEEDEEWQT